MKTINSVISLSLLAISIPACVAEDDPAPADDQPVSEAEQAVGSCPVSGTDISRSLVVTDPVALAKFSFKRVMTKIRNTAGVGGTQTNKGVFQQWMRTFDTGPGGCDDPEIDPNGYGLVCPRTHEAKLATIDPFATGATDTFQPTGLFDRFDLAPKNGANCGEYRVVFALHPDNVNIFGRGFLIFEAALPNPHPEQGLAACLPVAQFWQDLTNDNDAASRAAKLEKFYFTGTAVPGFPAVIDAHHYGLAADGTATAAGQVRTNFFIDNFEWHLREFKLEHGAGGKLAFDHVTVKTNPANELFDGTHANAAAFRTAFVKQVKSLTSSNVNLIHMSIDDDFNEYESVSQRADVVYRNSANGAMRTAIQNELTRLGSGLTVDNILDRATTQTCAGCHQVSNGVDLGGVRWPSSLFFVQIDENSNLSSALTTKFLPRRKRVLEAFINSQCGGVQADQAVDDGLTIGGSSVGAPN